MHAMPQRRDPDTGQFLPTRYNCDSCQVICINGSPCHETGCPESWIDLRTGKGCPVPCWECGCDYIPEERPYKYALCQGCKEDRES
jgi:hypothetical protein